MLLKRSLPIALISTVAITAFALLLPGSKSFTALGVVDSKGGGGGNAASAFTLPAGTNWTGLSHATGTRGLDARVGYFQGVKVFSRICLPHFRYFSTIKTCTDGNKISGPTISGLIGSGSNAYFKVTQKHRVSTPAGKVTITFKYLFFNSGKIVPQVTFNGPHGQYTFYIWVDMDLNGAGNDRVEYVSQWSSRLAFYAPSTEHYRSDYYYKYLDKYSLKFFDQAGLKNYTMYVKPRPEDQARMYYLRYEDMTNYPKSIKTPSQFDNNQTVNVRKPADFTGYWAKTGYDLACYYEVTRQTGSATVGPTLRFVNWQKRKVWLEIDRVDTIGSWLPTVVRCSKTWTLANIYKRAGINATVKNSDTIPDEVDGWTEAECHAAMIANRSYPENEDRWVAYCLLGSIDQPNVGYLGVMFDYSADPNLVPREGCITFWNNFYSAPVSDKRLRTTAHELGHAINLQHNDGDAWDDDSSSSDGTTLMNQTWTLASNWCYNFTTLSKQHLRYHSWKFVKPGECSSIFYDMQDMHKAAWASGW